MVSQRYGDPPGAHCELARRSPGGRFGQARDHRFDHLGGEGAGARGVVRIGRRRVPDLPVIHKPMIHVFPFIAALTKLGPLSRATWGAA